MLASFDRPSMGGIWISRFELRAVDRTAGGMVFVKLNV